VIWPASINDMKSDMDDKEFKNMVIQLAKIMDIGDKVKMVKGNPFGKVGIY